MLNTKNNWRECVNTFKSIFSFPFSFPTSKIIDLEKSEETLIVALGAT